MFGDLGAIIRRCGAPRNEAKGMDEKGRGVIMSGLCMHHAFNQVHNLWENQMIYMGQDFILYHFVAS